MLRFYFNLMKPTVATITLLLIVWTDHTFAQQTEVFDPSLLCSLIANGTKIKDPRYCNVYIECMNNTSVSGSCGAQFYDRNTQQCVDPDTIKCLSSDPCAATTTGFVSDPYSCNGYYYCNHGAGARGECSAGLNYNPETMNCIRNYPCDITMYPEDYCNIVPEGIFIKVPDSCTRYQTCWNSVLLNGTCPNGFYFNAFQGDCDFPHSVDCVEPGPPEPEIPADVKCTEGGVFISDGRSCDGYYYCSAKEDGGFDMIHGNCPVDRFFDPENGGECVVRTNTVCKYNRCVTLGLDYIQMANIDGDGCTGFSLCQHGEVIGEAECPNGLYFDEMSQLCVDEPVTYVACAILSNTTPESSTTDATTDSTDESTDESTDDSTTHTTPTTTTDTTPTTTTDTTPTTTTNTTPPTTTHTTATTTTDTTPTTATHTTPTTTTHTTPTTTTDTTTTPPPAENQKIAPSSL